MMENPPEERTGIVAVLGGRIVGSADIFQYKDAAARLATSACRCMTTSGGAASARR